MTSQIPDPGRPADGPGSVNGVLQAPESGEFDAVSNEPSDDSSGEASGSRAAGSSARAASTLSVTREALSLVRGLVHRIRTAMDRPLASYHLVLGLTAVLTVLGLVMVLSASSVEDISATGSPYSKFTSQLIYVALGVIAFLCALYLPPTMLRRFAFAGVVISTALLMAVLIPGIGTEVGGARRWIDVGGFTVQPSEFAKVALIVWGSHLLASRDRHRSATQTMWTLGAVAALMAALIIAEPNQSTAMIIVATTAMLLFYAGINLRLFFWAVVGIGAAGVVLALAEGYRSARLSAWLGRTDDALGANYQSNQARYSLADGGFFGVGLGNSTAKWSYLPNAHNDFIFAIIGEELGYLGAGLVVGMFGLLTWAGLRIARRVADPFLQLMAATITTLIALQAIINMGYVVGLLPVTGIQLPLLSAGGNSVVLMLFMLGMLANAARHEPAAIAAITAGSRGGRRFGLPQPRRYVAPGRAGAARAHRANDPRVGTSAGRPSARDAQPSPYDRYPYGDPRRARPAQDRRMGSREPAARQPGRPVEPWRGERRRSAERPVGRGHEQERRRRAW